MTSKKHIGFYTATSIVIANMIGTGVFTSLGFQLFGTHTVFALLMLWVVGGVVALCGALCYGELAAAMPRSGSEYHYLSKIYHPSIGFLSGWVSMTVGFAAPVALSAMLLGGYVSKVFPGVNETMVACGVVIALTAVHATSIKAGSGVQNTFTALKLTLICFIIIAGCFSTSHQPISLLPQEGSWSEIFSSGFALSLYWVTYSYSGWNASAYIAGEIDQPQKNVPRSLLRGTLFVTILYVLLNFIFLYTAPMGEMQGQKEVAYLPAKYIFGDTGGQIISGVIALLLVSSVSSMVIAGPRVAQVMGEDMTLLHFFSRKNANGIPWIAVIFQCCVSLGLILSAKFDAVLTYIGFTLNIFLFLTVLGLFILRMRNPDLPRPYKTFGYPVTPLLFLAVTGWVLYKGLEMKTQESLIGLATVLSGFIIYFIDRALRKK